MLSAETPTFAPRGQDLLVPTRQPSHLCWPSPVPWRSCSYDPFPP